MDKQYYDNDGEFVAGSADEHIQIGIELSDDDDSIEKMLEIATDYVCSATGLDLEHNRWDVYSEVVSYLHKLSNGESSESQKWLRLASSAI